MLVPDKQHVVANRQAWNVHPESVVGFIFKDRSFVLVIPNRQFSDFPALVPLRIDNAPRLVVTMSAFSSDRAAVQQMISVSAGSAEDNV